MMDLATIRALNQDAARASRKAGKEPWVPTAAERLQMARGIVPEGARLPYLGDYVPRGWRRSEAEDLFIDTTFEGYIGPSSDERGTPNLPRAMQLVSGDAEGTGYAMTEHGQFQGYLGRYERRK